MLQCGGVSSSFVTWLCFERDFFLYFATVFTHKYYYFISSVNHSLCAFYILSAAKKRGPVNKISMQYLKLIACSCSQPVHTRVHYLNMAQSYLTFTSARMKIVNMTSRVSGRSSQFLLKHPTSPPTLLAGIKTSGWLGCHSEAVLSSQRPH